MNPDDLTREFLAIADNNIPYLSQWYMETPVVITSERYEELQCVQKIIFKTISFFVNNYNNYGSIFCQSEAIRKITDICKEIKYRVGTYRPDFLIDNDENLKICEIGGRFPLNGYFASGFSEVIGIRKFSISSNISRCEYKRFLEYLFEYWGEDFDKVCVLKGYDRPCDIKYYVPFFEKLGITVHILSPDELVKNVGLLKNAAVVNEFNQMEIAALSGDVIKAIAESNSLNDLRTIFLIHDKRFLAVLNDELFTSAFLSEDERELLKKYIIPTFTIVQARNNSQIKDKWEDARYNKDKWLLKHCLLGKSEKVFAGCHSDQKQWIELLESDEIEDMVLQPYIKQKPLVSFIKNEMYNDYVTGTLLCFDDNFFGPGIFRTSSFEITNRLDDRKMSQLYSEADQISGSCFIL